MCLTYMLDKYIFVLYRESVLTYIYFAVELNMEARGPDIECL